MRITKSDFNLLFDDLKEKYTFGKIIKAELILFLRYISRAGASWHDFQMELGPGAEVPSKEIYRRVHYIANVIYRVYEKTFDMKLTRFLKSATIIEMMTTANGLDGICPADGRSAV